MPLTDTASVQLQPPKAVAAQVGCTVRHLRTLVRQGVAPTPVKIGERKIGFYSHEVTAWLSSLPRTRAAA
jgi:predicted DNA-binding transcriptional regulator AlpA